MISKYHVNGINFLENLKTTNPIHLKEILKYYDDCPHGVVVSRCNVRAYVAYCGVKGEADLELWKAIVKESNEIEKYPEYEDIWSEYSNIN